MQERTADQMAQLTKSVGKTRGIYDILRSIVIAVIFILIAVVMIFIGLPWYFPAVVIIVAVGIIMLSIATAKRTANVDLYTLDEPVPDSVPLEAGEVLVDTIPAVMRYMVTRSTSYLGTGKVHHPENALIITNRAIWALTVPLAGVDKVVAGTDIGSLQWMWHYKDIAEKLQEMLETLPLEEVFKQGRAKRLMGLEELKVTKTRLLSRDIRLIKSNGQTFRYSIRVKEDYLRAKEIFKIK